MFASNLDKSRRLSKHDAESTSGTPWSYVAARVVAAFIGIILLAKLVWHHGFSPKHSELEMLARRRLPDIVDSSARPAFRVEQPLPLTAAERLMKERVASLSSRLGETSDSNTKDEQVQELGRRVLRPAAAHSHKASLRKRIMPEDQVGDQSIAKWRFPASDAQMVSKRRAAHVPRKAEVVGKLGPASREDNKTHGVVAVGDLGLASKAPQAGSSSIQHVGPPVVETKNHLLPLAFESQVPQSHGQLGTVVQWDRYPYEEEAVAGFSQYKLPKPDKINVTNDQYFQEYVEDHMPIGGSLSMIHVKQHHDPARSYYILPFGPSLNQGRGCWGKCAWYRTTYGYAVESVHLTREDAKFELYMQTDLRVPIHSCTGAGCGYDFGMNDRGHWYVAVATPPAGKPEVQRLYVPLPNTCGQGLFTQPELTCSSQHYSQAEAAALATVSDLLAGSTQTPRMLFGMEIEGALRVPYTGVEKARRFEAVKAYFNGDRDPNGKAYQQMQSMYESQEIRKNLRAVTSCFNKATGGLFSKWDWEPENKLFQPEYVDAPEETWGVPFEITPGTTPHLLGADGLREVVQVMAGLESVGNQASFDNNVDVHLMVRHPGMGQREWTDREIARFWIGYAKYQYAIDELQTSSRVQNHWGQGLYAWAPKVQFMFQNLHRLIHGKPFETLTSASELCDSILGFGECDEKEWGGGWPSKHTPFKYHSINFAILKRFGSLEVKQHTATNSPERLARWVDVVLRMGDIFRSDTSLDEFFDEDVETDLKQLHDAQARVSLDDFFRAADVPKSSQEYWVRKKWARTPTGEWQKSCAERPFGGSYVRLTTEHDHKVQQWPPVVSTHNHLLPLASKDEVPQAHGQLGSVVQWRNYPYEEERIAGVSQYVLPDKINYTMDEYFQEYVEEHRPLCGTSARSLMHVEQQHDVARSSWVLPFGPSLRHGQCWGRCAWYRTTHGYAVMSVKLLQDNAKFELYLQADQSNPIHSCTGSGCGYEFGMEDRGRWFIAVAEPQQGEPEVQRIYVPFPSSCGIGLFTQPELTCSPTQQATHEKTALALLSDLIEGPFASPPVAFGIEIEGGLRQPYKGAKKAEQFKLVEAYFNGDRDPKGRVYDEMQNMYDNEQYQNLGSVTQCFNQATSGRFSKWNWESEDKVMQPEYVDDASEIWAVPFELTGPNPPKLLGANGLREVVQVMAGLESVGNQATPDNNFDVHIMVRRAETGQPEWTDREIARFWIGYAKFQYAIDELHASSRVQNHWGQGLYAWAPKVQYMFQNIHRLVHGKPRNSTSTVEDLCDGILGYGECDSRGGGSWPAKHTPFKYHSINFAILKRFGSLEVKQHTATNSPERLARWVDVVLRMAHAFRKDPTLDTYLNGHVEDDLRYLHDHQARATLDDFFSAIDLPESSRRYYKERRWAKTTDGKWLARCVDGGVGSVGHGLGDNK